MTGAHHPPGIIAPIAKRKIDFDLSHESKVIYFYYFREKIHRMDDIWPAGLWPQRITDVPRRGGFL